MSAGRPAAPAASKLPVKGLPASLSSSSLGSSDNNGATSKGEERGLCVCTCTSVRWILLLTHTLCHPSGFTLVWFPPQCWLNFPVSTVVFVRYSQLLSVRFLTGWILSSVPLSPPLTPGSVCVCVCALSNVYPFSVEVKGHIWPGIFFFHPQIHMTITQSVFVILPYVFHCINC